MLDQIQYKSMKELNKPLEDWADSVQNDQTFRQGVAAWKEKEKKAIAEKVLEIKENIDAKKQTVEDDIHTKLKTLKEKLRSDILSRISQFTSDSPRGKLRFIITEILYIYLTQYM